MTLLESRYQRSRAERRDAPARRVRPLRYPRVPAGGHGELAAEAGFEIDAEGFDALMEEQRERAKRSARERARRVELAAVAVEAGTTSSSDTALESDGRVLALIGPGGGSRSRPGRESPSCSTGHRSTRNRADSRGPRPGPGPRGEGRSIGYASGPAASSCTPVSSVRQDPRGRGGPRRGRPGAARATARAHTATHVLHWPCATCLAIMRGRPARSSRPTGSARLPAPPGGPAGRARADRGAGQPPAGRGRPVTSTSDDGGGQTGERSRCSARSTATSSGWSRWGTTRSSSAGEPTSTTRARSRSCGSSRGVIGAGMRRVEALVGPDALRE